MAKDRPINQTASPFGRTAAGIGHALDDVREHAHIAHPNANHSPRPAMTPSGLGRALFERASARRHTPDFGSTGSLHVGVRK